MTIPMAPKPRIIIAHAEGSGTAGALMLPRKDTDTCDGRVLASVRPSPWKVPDAPRNRPVPLSIVYIHATALMPGVAVDVAPPSIAAFSHWRDQIGSPLDQRVIARSPARAPENFRAPVLLIHAEQDTVVPILQSELIDRALADAGKTHRLVRLAGEDHWQSRSSTRTQVLQEIEQFLAASLRTAP